MYVGNIKIRPFMLVFDLISILAWLMTSAVWILNYYHFIDKVPIKAPFNEV